MAIQIEPRIYLASRSPRRRELLEQIGVHFELLLDRSVQFGEHDVDESILPGEDPVTYVERVTLAKARSGIQRVRDRHLVPHPVLAADTAVVLGKEILGKPRDEQHAIDMLTRLSGQTHQVLTAVAMADAHRIEHRLQTNTVCFRPLTQHEIRQYVSTGEPMDKAGAYAIQGRAALFAHSIQGSYTGIMGLPLFETGELLKLFSYPI